MTIEEKLDLILKRLDSIESRIWKQEPYTYSDAKCPKCGIDFSGVMGYYCPDLHCPMMTKATF